MYISRQWDAVQLVFFLDGVVPNTLLITEVKGRRFSRFNYIIVVMAILVILVLYFYLNL